MTQSTSSMAPPLVLDPAQMGYDEFVAWLRPLLWTLVRELVKPGEPNGEPSNVPAVREDQRAFEAARLMRRHGQAWLAVEDAEGKPAGFIHEDALGEALRFIDTAPFLGETAMADLLRPPESSTANQV